MAAAEQLDAHPHPHLTHLKVPKAPSRSGAPIPLAETRGLLPSQCASAACSGRCAIQFANAWNDNMEELLIKDLSFLSEDFPSGFNRLSQMVLILIKIVSSEKL